MIKTAAVTEEDKVLMTRYNIKSETRTLFYSEGYKYDNLKDALKYAKLLVERKQGSGKE